MQEQNGRRLYCASDVVVFLECEHTNTLALLNFCDLVLKNEGEDGRLD